jgi:polysaccharide biosynthesis/export protein
MTKRHIREHTLAILAVLFAIVLTSGRELSGQEQRRDRSAVERRTELERDRTIVDLTVPALDDIVTSQDYITGPNDILGVNIWIDPPLSFTLPVTPEGTVIVPTVGEFTVAGLSLEQAKNIIINGIKKYYLLGNPTVTLLKPRQVAVTVTGNVHNPGRYILFATERVETAIERANRQEIEPIRWQDRVFPSTRNIMITRRGQSILRADIPMYYATKDSKWNPFLMEGDIIFVPRFEEHEAVRAGRNVIGVYGGVKAPGQYEYVPGDSLRDAIQIVFGFTEQAVIDSIIHSRLSLDGSNISNTYVNGTALLNGLIPDIALEPGDRIIVNERYDDREDYRVRVEGAVRYPGVYPITRDQTSLSEILPLAGGFTDNASIRNAEVRRRSVPIDEIELERLLSQRGAVSAFDSTYYYLETELRIERELVNVNFERLFLQNDQTHDIILKSGDLIIVPTDRKTIYVYGQVVSPGNIPFVHGQPVAHYLDQAGGFTNRARKRGLMIIKRSTGQWLKPNETIIEDGDHIWVPKKVDRRFEDYLRMTSQAATVVGVAISTILLVIQITDK